MAIYIRNKDSIEKPMLGSSLSETEIDIIALVAVFGAISATFFIMGTRGRKRAEKVA